MIILQAGLTYTFDSPIDLTSIGWEEKMRATCALQEQLAAGRGEALRDGECGHVSEDHSFALPAR